MLCLNCKTLGTELLLECKDVTALYDRKCKKGLIFLTFALTSSLTVIVMSLLAVTVLLRYFVSRSNFK